MRTLFTLFAFAAAAVMAPAASAVNMTGPAPANQSLSAPSVAAGAQEEPSDTQVANTAMAARTAPTASVGQPDGRAALQEQVTEFGQEAAWFHNWLLLPIIAVISAFVLILMLFAIVRFRRGAHPVPSRTTHNTTLEVVWTLVPVLILVVIAVPSIGMLRDQYSPPRADVTVKVIGNQWYWEYEYPDHGVNLVSNILPDAQAQARGEPRQLAVDERMVVPVGATVKLIVTSNDVIHAWGVPAFWTKIDAVPGRLNETWFRAERPGVYYGVCYELCGVRHGYMPIAVEVVPAAQFAAWIASRGGSMPGAGARPTGTPAEGNARPGVTAGSATEAAPGANVSAGTAAPPVVNQAGASNEDGN